MLFELRLSGRLPLRAQNAGLFVSRGVGRHPDRVIDSHELIFVRKGTLSIFEETRRFEVGAGEALLLRPGRRHGGEAEYPRDLSFYWIHFSLAKTAAGGRTLGVVPQYGPVARPDRLAELFHRFLDDQETGRLDPAEAALLTLLMLREAGDRRPAQAADGAATLAARAHRFILAHFHEPVATDAIARALRCNPDYLGRAFRIAAGKTLTEALHECRLRKARALLLDGERNVDEVARACGFADPGYFRRLFRRREGVTPRAFRQQAVRLHLNTE